MKAFEEAMENLDSLVYSSEVIQFPFKIYSSCAYKKMRQNASTILYGTLSFQLNNKSFVFKKFDFPEHMQKHYLFSESVDMNVKPAK